MIPTAELHRRLRHALWALNQQGHLQRLSFVSDVTIVRLFEIINGDDASIHEDLVLDNLRYMQ